MSASKNAAKFPIHSMPLWKGMAFSLLAFLPFSGLLVFLPPFFLPEGLYIAGALVLGGMVAFNWGRLGNPHASRVVGGFIFTTQFLALAIRSWDLAVGLHWSGVLTLVAAFLLAWALPVLNPKISHFLWQEQIAPQTKLGRRWLTIVLALLPSAGVLGASAGLFSSRFGETKFAYLILAILSSIGAVVLSQDISHQLLGPKQGRTTLAASEHRKGRSQEVG